MMRLIDADKLEIRKLAEFNDEYGDAVPVYGVEVEDIDNAPTVDAIVLPVKVGQTVWLIVNNGVTDDYVNQFLMDIGTYPYSFDEIGKYVFLTREAAEAALKAR